MVFDKTLQEETKIIFERNYLAELTDEIIVSDEEDDAYTTRAQNLINDFGWNTTFMCWKDYLTSNCNTTDKALNFAHLFWHYGGCDYAIPDPYNFLAYFYHRIKVSEYPDEITILDTIAIETLTKCGIGNVNWSDNPDYVPELDPKILVEVEKYRAAEELQ